ncbi:MAG: hypothetical protein V1717_03615 [Candidatus Micrarchaeota archaeon]
MRIGFVTALTNDFDARPLIQQIASTEVGVELDLEQAPTILNTPAGVKRLFNNGVDACIVFVQSSEEEKMSLALAQEKIVDVEKDFGKYCLVCTVLDEEGNIEELAGERLKECLHLLLGVRPEKPVSETPLDMFSTPPGGSSPEFFSPSSGSGGKPLF